MLVLPSSQNHGPAGDALVDRPRSSRWSTAAAASPRRSSTTSGEVTAAFPDQASVDYLRAARRAQRGGAARPGRRHAVGGTVDRRSTAGHHPAGRRRGGVPARATAGADGGARPAPASGLTLLRRLPARLGTVSDRRVRAGRSAAPARRWSPGRRRARRRGRRRPGRRRRCAGPRPAPGRRMSRIDEAAQHHHGDQPQRRRPARRRPPGRPACRWPRRAARRRRRRSSTTSATCQARNAPQRGRASTASGSSQSTNCCDQTLLKIRNAATTRKASWASRGRRGAQQRQHGDRRGRPARTARTTAC